MNQHSRKAALVRKKHPLMVGIFLVIISMAVFYWHFAKQKINAISDLDTIQGRLSHYSFTQTISPRGGYYYKYYLFLDGDNNRYQIPADFIDYFDKGNFESFIQPGKALTIQIDKRLMVFSISDTERSYLSANDTIYQYNHSDIRAGLFFLMMGCCSLLVRIFFDRLPLLFTKPLSGTLAVSLVVILVSAIVFWLAVYFKL